MKVLRNGRNAVNTYSYFYCADCGSVFALNEAELHECASMMTVPQCPVCGSENVNPYIPSITEQIEFSKVLKDELVAPSDKNTTAKDTTTKEPIDSHSVTPDNTLVLEVGPFYPSRRRRPIMKPAKAAKSAKADTDGDKAIKDAGENIKECQRKDCPYAMKTFELVYKNGQISDKAGVVCLKTGKACKK